MESTEASLNTTERESLDDLIVQVGARTIWRFMDFWKFEQIVKTRMLYFRRIDRLEDEFEGDVPRPELDKASNNTEFWNSELHKDFRRLTFVNCWHRSVFENALMWRAYTNFPRQPSLAIRCDLLNLVHSITDPVKIAPVSYVDYSRDKFHGFEQNPFAWMHRMDGLTTPYFHKRIEFESEQELRALLVATPLEDGPIKPHPSDGFNIACLLPTLLKQIVLSPKAPFEFYQKVCSLLRQNGLGSVAVTRSALDVKPNIERASIKS